MKTVYKMCLLVMISLMVASSLSLSHGIKVCGVGRCNAGEWKYEAGRVYSYQYAVEATTVINGASDQQSTFSFTARAEIGAIGPCTFVLKLSGVRGGKVGSAKAEDFSRVLEQHNTNFAMDSGQVTEVCSTNSDPVWALNLKKGILSTFQQTIGPDTGNGNITETTVVGR